AGPPPEPTPDEPAGSGAGAGGRTVPASLTVLLPCRGALAPPPPLPFPPASTPCPPPLLCVEGVCAGGGGASESAAVAAAPAAAAWPSGPCFSSFLALCEPRTLAGDRWLGFWSVFLSPPEVGIVSVYWVAAELLGGTTASSTWAAAAGVAKIAAIAIAADESRMLGAFNVFVLDAPT